MMERKRTRAANGSVLKHTDRIIVKHSHEEDHTRKTISITVRDKCVVKCNDSVYFKL